MHAFYGDIVSVFFDMDLKEEMAISS